MLHLSASKYLSNKPLFIDLLSKMADQLHGRALRKLLYDNSHMVNLYFENPEVKIARKLNQISYETDTTTKKLLKKK